jgi:hypothetical protein
MKLIIDRASMSVAVADSFVISRFGTTTVEDLDDLLHLQQGVVKAHGVVSSLSLVPTNNGATKSGEGIKEKSAEFMRTIGKAQVGSPCPQEVFSDPDEALTWLAGLTGQRPLPRVTTDQLTSVFQRDVTARAA